jgi:glycosyltransferase involved in cell wall biosynthesis
MKLAVSGFVSEQAGSVASANALLLRELLLLGHEVHFFSKASFVDPRPAVGNLEGFRFFDTTNTGPDQLRRRLSRVPVAGFLAGLFDASTYSRLLVSEMTRKHAVEKYDLCLWLGEFSRGRTNAVPAVSFIQGPPGTDARSILDRFDEVKALAGFGKAIKWRILALLRLSRIGLPPLALTDHFIVGSRISKQTLNAIYGVRNERIFTLPYPIDLNIFHLNVLRPFGSGEGAGSLRACWLGRVIPRKRLDLFLNGAALAIREGIDVRLTLVGGIGFVPGYEKLIEAFPYPDRLRWEKGIPREKVPALLGEQDVLIQPSDEENFGSSVAEAQACGLPVIVGYTNGNADYLCSRDVHLRDDRPETLAAALRDLSLRKAEGRLGDPAESRRCAEQYFSLDRVTKSLVEILESVIARRP